MSYLVSLMLAPRQLALPLAISFSRSPLKSSPSPTEIKALVFGRTWQGHLGSKVKFVQEFGKDGSFAIYTGSSLNTGIATVNDDLLCLSGVYRGQDTCGSVYRNPEGSAEQQNEYIYVIPNRLFNFSAVK